MKGILGIQAGILEEFWRKSLREFWKKNTESVMNGVPEKKNRETSLTKSPENPKRATGESLEGLLEPS